MSDPHPHDGQPVLTAGVPLAQAKAVLILIHGRGATAASILKLADELPHPAMAYLAPQAAGNTWYPDRFLAPLERNEPYVSSALRVVGEMVANGIENGIPAERILLGGFSQGACLSLEFAARKAQRYGGIIGLSGALIGPDDLRREDRGSLAGTPVFLGCSDVDSHIPKQRVIHATEVLKALGGSVTMRLYPGMGHTINRDEIDFIRHLIQNLLA